MKIVITDGYSTSNAGDAELVRLTIEIVRARFDRRPVVLATDPTSFSGYAADFSLKPLSRLGWRASSGAARATWLLREGMALCAMFFVPALPKGLRRGAIGALRSMAPSWLVELRDADAVIAVGGGYLGDRYGRESLVTLLTFRFALALGASVETMPISISSANSKLLRRALRATRAVTWRSRERITYDILATCGIDSELVPDLAWLNESVAPLVREGLAVAPVGSAFYGAGELTPKVWPEVEAALHDVRQGGTVRLVPMHSWSRDLGDGGDDRACDALGSLIGASRPDIRVERPVVRDYDDVRRAMAASEFAVCERLHAALAALTTSTPVTVVSYEPKHAGVLGLAGLGRLAVEEGGRCGVTSEEIEKAAAHQRSKIQGAVLR